VANKENNGAACISDITVEDILSAAKEALRRERIEDAVEAVAQVVSVREAGRSTGNGHDPETDLLLQQWNLGDSARGQVKHG